MSMTITPEGQGTQASTGSTGSTARAGSAGSTPRRRSRAGLVLVAGLGVAAISAVLGGQFRGNASFAEQYVGRQLKEQRITFSPAEALSAEERESPCLVRYAGKAVTTGKQAECYANEFIGRHLRSVAGGRTFSEMRPVQDDLRAKLAVAQGAGDAAVVADLNKQLAAVTGQRSALLEGTSMRGLLLTSYGFSELGAKAGQAATAANAAAGGALVLGVIVALVLRRRGVRA